MRIVSRKNLTASARRFLNVDRNEYLQKYGVVPGAAAPAAEIRNTDAIAKKREELELKKLEIELSKLEKPDTSIDYYSKMLELQEKSFSQQMEMLKQQGDLRLEIEKLKLMGDGDSDSMLPYLQMLAPLLPEIIKSKGAKKEGAAAKAAAPLNTQKEENMEVPKTAGELEEYKAAVRRGEISLEEAYEDFLSTPFANSLTKEQFEVKFNEIKSEKVESKTI